MGPALKVESFRGSKALIESGNDKMQRHAVSTREARRCSVLVPQAVILYYKIKLKTRMHSSRMRAARSSSRHPRGGRGSALVNAGIHTPWVWVWIPPGCGPGDPQGVVLETPPRCGPGDPLGVGLETPLPDPSTSPLGVGLETPGDLLLQGMLEYHLQCMLRYHPPPPPREQNHRHV